MNILIDIRPLISPLQGGVATYTRGMIDALLKRGAHDYRLFSSGMSEPAGTPPGADLIHARVPNKLINLSLALTRRPRLDRISKGDDLTYFPNLNFAATAAPSIVTVHDLSFIRYPQFFSPRARLWHAMIAPRRLLKNAAGVIAVSAHTKADLVETFGLPEEKIFVVPPGVDGEKFSAPTEKDRAHVRAHYGLQRPYFLSLAAIEPRKNVEGIIEAFETSRADADLVIAGPAGWLCRGAFDRAERSPRRERIRFIGPVAETDKPALLAEAVALVYPSFYEGFGLPPLEALAAGTPVISSHASSLGQVVGDAGIMVDPYNTAELADAMSAILEDDRLRDLLGIRGRERASHFSWDKSAEKLEKIFTSLSDQTKTFTRPLDRSATRPLR